MGQYVQGLAVWYNTSRSNRAIGGRAMEAPRKVVATFTVNKDGSKSELHIEGIKGEGCTNIRDKVQLALGKISKEEYTSEAFEQDNEVQEVGFSR